jgi:predicted RNA-binding Zn ribbon-like protein
MTKVPSTLRTAVDAAEPGRVPKFSSAAELPRIGGHVALDFANTVDWRDRGPLDHLVDYLALVMWAAAAGVVTSPEADALVRRAAAGPAEASAVLRSALDLREAAHRLCRAAAAGRAGEAPDLAVLNRLLQRYPLRGEIVVSGESYAWRGAASDEALALPVERLAAAAAELLLSAAELRRVRLCDGAGCGWLFLDTSPNRRRRWCSMESCGNRAKARRHHAKIRDRG